MIRLSPTKVLTAAEAVALTTHRGSDGTDHADVVTATTELAESDRVLVVGCEMETINNEQSTAIGGDAANEFIPTALIFHVEDVGAGAAANGDIEVSVGISTGGTQILVATTLTNLISLNDRFEIAITGLTNTIPANSTLYVKVTAADTTAGVGHLMDTYIVGKIFVSGT
jgi:hypothetical protein